MRLPKLKSLWIQIGLCHIILCPRCTADISANNPPGQPCLDHVQGCQHCNVDKEYDGARLRLYQTDQASCHSIFATTLTMQAVQNLQLLGPPHSMPVPHPEEQGRQLLQQWPAFPSSLCCGSAPQPRSGRSRQRSGAAPWACQWLCSGSQPPAWAAHAPTLRRESPAKQGITVFN